MSTELPRDHEMTRAQFVMKINALVADGREDLIPEITDEYVRLVEARRAERAKAA